LQAAAFLALMMAFSIKVLPVSSASATLNWDCGKMRIFAKIA
jgi:hypothetical protein